jgi:protein involved in plasmid replication-relaxation
VVCERRYRVGEQWYNLRPDALAEYRVGSQQMRFWWEWDLGTMNPRDLVVKFTSYAQYIASLQILSLVTLLARKTERSERCLPVESLR